MKIEIVNYDPALIDASPYQVREHFQEAALEELAESIRTHGIVQPLTARESPRDPARLELVAGERRLRAARLAGLEAVPVIVHELTDRQAQEIVLIENLQREDLTVSEEAKGYRKALELRDEAGQPVYTQESLAAKIGKPLNHVRDRLKLLACPPRLIEAVEAREVALSTAMLVGRIPDEKAREEAAKRVLAPRQQEVPLNYEQTREMIREEFMVSLQKPGFDPEDEGLVPVKLDEQTGERLLGGSCVGCPFAVEPQPHAVEMESPKGGKKISAGQAVALCTLPACFKKKQDAAWRIVRRQAEEAGQRVIEGDAAVKLFSRWGGGLASNADYVELDSAPDYEHIGMKAYDNKKTFRTLLKKADVEVVLARHPQTGRRVELAERKAAVSIVKAKLNNTDPKLEVESAEKADALRKEQRKEELRKQKMEALVLHECMTEVQARIASKGLGVEDLDYVFQLALSNSGADGFTFFKSWLELTMPKGTASSPRDFEESILEKVRAQATTPEMWLGWIVAALLARPLKYSGVQDEDLQELMKRLGVKQSEIERRAEALLNATAGGKKAKKSQQAAEKMGVGGEMAPIYAPNEAEFVRALLGSEILPTEPNENGVFAEATQISIALEGEAGRSAPPWGGGYGLTIRLACTPAGSWHWGHQWRRPEPDADSSAVLGGSRPAMTDKKAKTRIMAVSFALDGLLKDLQGLDCMPMPCNVQRLERICQSLFADDLPAAKPVPVKRAKKGKAKKAA
jgi:ParB/RepB/Spo0J family partition protein